MGSPRRVRLAALIDLGIFALLALVPLVHLTGGFAAAPLGVRISVTSTDRVFLWVVALVVLRHVILPRPSLVESLRSRLVRAGSEDPVPASLSVRRQALTAGAALVFFALVTVTVLHEQARNLYGVPDLGDPLFSIWRLAWFAHQAPRDPGSLFDGNIFHPEPATLAYSDAMLLTGAAAAPLFWIGLDAVVVYNLLLLASFALAGLAMFGLVWRLTGDRSAAVVAGLVFGFYAYRFSHYSHLELLITMWMPLALLALHRLLATGRMRDGIVLGLIAGAQGLSSLYYGLFLCMFLAAIVLFLWGAATTSLARVQRPLLAGAAIALLMAAPLAVPYSKARATVGDRDAREVVTYSAQARDYAASHHRSRWYASALRATDNAERQLFPGFVPIAVAILALWPPLSAVRLTYVLALLLSIEISLGLNGSIYPWLYRLSVPFQGLRVPARFGMLTGLSLAVLAGLGLAHVASRWRPAHRRLLAAICGLAVIAEAWPAALRLVTVSREPPPIYELVRPGAVIAALPFPEGEKFWIDPTYMYFSTFGWPRLVNGNSAFYPPWHEELRQGMMRFPDEWGLRALERHHVEFVLLHGLFYEPEQYSEVAARFDREPRLQLIRAQRWQGHEYRLYKLLGSSPADGGTLPGSPW